MPQTKKLTARPLHSGQANSGTRHGSKIPPKQNELPPLEELLDQPVINVLGGGPSVRNAKDRNRMAELDGPWIGACRAGLLFDCELTIACDRRFTSQCPDEISKYINGGGMLVRPVRPTLEPEEGLDPRIIVIEWKHGRQLDLSRKGVYGLDSGFAAFNAAVAYRPREIRLFGFDYTVAGDRERWHSGYGEAHTKNLDGQLFTWALQYDAVASKALDLGITVRNFIGDPPSRLNRFLRHRLEDLPNV